MELRDFVKETLIQISAGVRDAQEEARKTGGVVNPAVYGVRTESYFAAMDHGTNVFLVDFDVAVTVTEGTATDAKAKLSVASVLTLGAGGQSENSRSATSRVAFKVPIALPVDQETLAKQRTREEQQDIAISRSQRGDY